MKMRGVACGVTMLALLVAGCRRHQPGAADLFNDPARLAGALPYPVLEWKPLTSSVDRGAGTTSTLFGNDAAVAAARTGVAYPAGAVVALATWKQREDEHWFGGRIPGEPVAVEVVEYGAGPVPVYRRFAGSPMVEQAESGSAERLTAIEAMKAARLP